MKTIALAGATGNLGGLIAAALIEQGAAVRAIVRPGTEPDRLQKLRDAGVEIREGEMSSVENLTDILGGSDCVLSALQGLREVMVDGQSVLLDAAVAAGVPRFIPSDFSVNYNHLERDQNRNFDLRRDFAAILEVKRPSRRPRFGTAPSPLCWGGICRCSTPKPTPSRSGATRISAPPIPR